MISKKGQIVKGIAGFYYLLSDGDIYECKAKGIFRKDKKKPLVGDICNLLVLDEAAKEGNIIEILPRKSEMIRPAVANVDQVLVIFALEKPKPNLALLDKFLLMMEWQRIRTVLCFNKKDIADVNEADRLKLNYRDSGCGMLFVSAKEEAGIDEIRHVLSSKVSVVAGPSGVGKSSITNRLQTDVVMETGEISKKLKRGKHTTRHSQMIPLDADTWIIDTPGFSALDLIKVEKEELKEYYPEFLPYIGTCRYQGCNHMDEPGCAVKKAVKEEKISAFRYENYRTFFLELKERERTKY